MQIKYFNSSFNNNINKEILDKKIFEIINSLTALNIISDKNLLDKTVKLVQQFKHNKNRIVVFGTGGSNLGARALNRIRLIKNVNIEFYDNIDPIFFENSFEKINFDNTGFIIVSKSGSTPETLSQFASIYQIALQRNKVGNFLSNLLIITEFKKSPLYQIAIEHNCLILEHDKNIGGRYSVFSNVGIVPAIISGINITEIYKGALSVIKNIENNGSLNLAKYLCFQSDNQYKLNVLMTYSDLLYYYGKWYLQLWAESIGKNNKGITALHSVGTTDQHSQLQLYLDGPKDKFFTFVTTNHSQKGMKINSDIFKSTEVDFFYNKTMGDLMDAEQRATIETFKQNNFSFREIYIPKVDEENLGKLLALSIIETIASCLYLNVDPFDQPAVEQGKILTKKYLR